MPLRTIGINLYCDEIKKSRIVDSIRGNEHWFYIGLLIVPIEIESQLIKKLCDFRCGNISNGAGWGSCDPICSFHSKNNKEIHYRKAQSADIYHVARKWINFANKDGIYTFFYILGINLDNLDYTCFGNNNPSQRFEIIYNRFFRTALLKSIKGYFYNYDRIIVENIYHDRADIAHHYYFPWHSIYRLEADDPKISVNTNSVEFIESCHNRSNRGCSHLIQYIDIIMGAIFNALHWESKIKHKENLALAIKPLLERMIRTPRNRNSSYNIHNRKCIDFFPSSTLSEFNDLPLRGTFFKNREIRIERKQQQRLFD